MLPSRLRLLVRLALATAALLALAPAAARANAAVSEAACPAGVAGTCVYYTGNANEFDAYQLTADAAFVHLTPTHLNDILTLPLGVPMTPGTGCSPDTVAGSVKCTRPVTAIVIDARGGDDWLTKHNNCGDCLRVIADMGDGNDILGGTSFPDVMKGGPGNDILSSYEGDDKLDGGPGDDTFDPQLGADDVVGGAGHDTIAYHRTSAQSVSVTLDDQPNDGEPTEKDNVHGDVEDITGGKGNDLLVGNELANVLSGDVDPTIGVDGNDTIDGGGGADSLFGNGGDDLLKARDGVPDTVDCGLGTDKAIVDTIDTVRNCETVDASKELEPDADGDGIAKPADCNDSNPSIKPGAVDIPENGVDEDCDGADAVNFDRDGDGYQRPQDCNDNNAKINPGVTDIPGNRLDEDCNGTAATYPLLASTVGFDYDTTRDHRAVFTQLFVRRPSAGSTVRLRCAGKGCKFRFKSVKIKKSSVRLNIARLVRGLRLRRSSSLEVRITKPQTIGVVTRFTMAKKLRRTEQCIEPGATRPGACPST
ncbi:MAG: hypothetical protein QOF69_2224 [Solirubrobacteraceae bacterium]|nr:hypothetical protein [Solirubrobacteraceae bacterium]